MLTVIPLTPGSASSEPTVVHTYGDEPVTNAQQQCAPRGRSLSRSPSRASIVTRSQSPNSVREVPILGREEPMLCGVRPCQPPVVFCHPPSVRSLSRSPSWRTRSPSPVPIRVPSFTGWPSQGPAGGVPPGPVYIPSHIQVSRPPSPIRISRSPSPIVHPPTVVICSPPVSDSPELLAYRFDGELAYVPAGQTYDEALGYVAEVFPALASVARDRIAFSIAARRGKMVRVPRCAWTAVLRDLKKYEVVDVKVVPEPGAPPEYPADGKADGKPKKRGSWLARMFGRA